jgi:hypothetical protein
MWLGATCKLDVIQLALIKLPWIFLYVGKILGWLVEFVITVPKSLRERVKVYILAKALGEPGHS